MRITQVDVTPIAMPIHAPRRHSDGVTAWTIRTLLEIRTDEGLVGLGEVGPRVSQDRIKGMAQRLVGEDPFALTRLKLRFLRSKFYFQDVASLFAGVEMACLDLQGKASGRPLSDLIGGRLRDEIDLIAYVFQLDGTSTRAPVHTVDELVHHTRDLVQTYGFRTIKLKGGMNRPEYDIELTHAVRDIFPDAALRLDPNAAWTVETSLHVARAVRSCNLEWLEDPAFGMQGMAEVTRRGEIPTATNMCLTHAGEFASAVALRAVDVVLCDIGYAGGTTEARQLAGMCDAFGMGVGVHSQGELGIAMSAMLHLASTMPSLVHAMDAHYHHLTDDILVGGLMPIREGRMQVPTGPGLGVELDRDRVEQYATLYRETASARRAGSPDPTRPEWYPTYPAW